MFFSVIYCPGFPDHRDLISKKIKSTKKIINGFWCLQPLKRWDVYGGLDI